MLILMSVKPTLTDELLKVNSSLKPIFSAIEDQCSGGQGSSKWEDSTSKQAHVEQTAERLLISSSFTRFRIV